MNEGVIIYKAEQRIVADTDYLQYYTLNHIQPAGRLKNSPAGLLFLSDAVLSPKQTILLTQFNNCHLLILPIVGGIEINHLKAPENFVGAEQFYWKPFNEQLSVTNLFDQNEVSCLFLGFEHGTEKNPKEQIGTIDFSQRNNLTCFIANSSLKISTGIFDGRAETLYQTSAGNNHVFCFVIRGVFEVNGRLLHPKDGLSFTGTAEIDLEALAENSIILIIELE